MKTESVERKASVKSISTNSHAPKLSLTYGVSVVEVKAQLQHTIRREVHSMNRFWTQFTYIIFVTIISLGFGVPALRASKTKDKLVFERKLTGDRDIEIFMRTNGGIERLTENEVLGLYPSLSPDGRKIAFSCGGNNDADIFIMDDRTNIFHISFLAFCILT